MNLITIRNSKLTVTISTMGAELQSIVDEKGTQRLWQGDPKYWKGRAPILFPVAGGFKDDCYELDGVRYPMGKHGFARKVEWEVETVTKDTATFLLTLQTEGFPFVYELRARFALTGISLMVTYLVTNRDKRAFYFSLGAHEAYVTPGGLEACTIVFDEEEKLENHVLDGNNLKPEPVVMMEKVRELPMKTEYFAVDALVFRALKSRGVTLKSKASADEIHVDFPEHDVLMFWTRPGADYLCIEPWCNAPDFTNADLRIDHKPGFMRLEPGQTIARKHVITVR